MQISSVISAEKYQNCPLNPITKEANTFALAARTENMTGSGFKSYMVGELSSRTRHHVLAVAALDKSLSMV